MAENISADEVALYDRQIRLWGMDAQNRMRNANILLINLSALASEVAKNIVLAGIGSLTILDSKTVAEEDLGANFFLTNEDVGKNRGAAGKIRVQNLNKRVKVEAIEKDLKSVEAEWISRFDIVVATGLTFDETVYVNEQVRADNKCFYSAGLMGMYGFVFADLVEHGFKIERNKPNKQTQLGAENDYTKIVSSEVRKDGENYVETVAKSITYQPLSKALENCKDGKFGSQFRARKLAKMSPVLPAVLSSWLDESVTKESVINQAHALGIPAGVITDEFCQTFLRSRTAEISPVAAVIGGVLGQDILNVLAQKGQPIHNLFVFNGDTNEGPIYKI